MKELFLVEVKGFVYVLATGLREAELEASLCISGSEFGLEYDVFSVREELVRAPNYYFDYTDEEPLNNGDDARTVGEHIAALKLELGKAP